MTDEVHQEAPAAGLYLTVRDTDEFGPAGHFVDLTSDQAKTAGDAVATPTPEQLALR